MSETKTIFQSRWGWHPVNYATYLKLKSIKKWYFQNLHEKAAWHRWNRKLPKNRVIRKWIRDKTGRKCGHIIVGLRPEPRVCPHHISDTFLVDFENSRHPRSKEEVFANRHTIDEINLLYAKLKTWYEN